MLSYNCLCLFTETHPVLSQMIQRFIEVTEHEISRIDSLILSSETLSLAPEDLIYYKNELNALRKDDIQLLQLLRSFAAAIRKNLP